MEKNEITSYDNSIMSLNDIINDKFKKEVEFNALEEYERKELFSYLIQNSNQFKIVEKRGYDVLRKKFFVFLFQPKNDYGWKDAFIKVEFDNFDEYYSFICGKIYDDSCYFGYKFSETQISKYNIVIENINFISFIKETIDDYTFETVYLNKLEKAKVENEILKKWLEKRKPISSIKTLYNRYRLFIKEFNYPHIEKIFFSLLIQMYGEEFKNLLVDYFCEYDNLGGICFYEILIGCGPEFAKKILEKVLNMNSPRFQKRKIKKMKLDYELYLKSKEKIKHYLLYNNKAHLYYINSMIDDEKRKSFIAYSQYYFNSQDIYEQYKHSKIEFENVCIADISKFNYVVSKTNRVYDSFACEKVLKKYKGSKFVVGQRWLDADGTIIAEKCNKFNWFFDFVYFLKGNLTHADLVMCEGLENIDFLKEYKIDDIRVRSIVARNNNLKLDIIDESLKVDSNYYPLQSINNEKESEIIFQMTRDDSDCDFKKIAYISDMHLIHRAIENKCETKEDLNYVIRSIVENLIDSKIFNGIICGDISSSFEIYKDFINELHNSSRTTDYFITLGNHELWSFYGKNIKEIVESYEKIMPDNFHLVQNNLFYYEDGKIKIITTEELLSISNDCLRKKLRKSKLIIFGGIGFSGRNLEFNANSNIYRGVITREQEIEESNKFFELYSKICESLFDKNVIIATHMPFEDWSINEKRQDKFVYVSGHNHKNYFFDDGIRRIFSDNQVGYYGKNVYWKNLYMDYGYEWFSDYPDGIHEISAEDYINFGHGKGYGFDFNREFKNLYMLKSNDIYMFLMKNMSDNLMILNGGAIKKVVNHTLNYYYEKMSIYANAIKTFLSSYSEYQNNIAKTIKSIGGSGEIHGCIVDIDFYNHLYVNPIDGKVTPYYALSIDDKTVYQNLISLLKDQNSLLYDNYKKMLLTKEKNELINIDNSLVESEKTEKVYSTEMYSISRIISGLQYTTNYNVIRIWNDALIDDKENANKLIVENLIENNKEIKN